MSHKFRETFCSQCGGEFGPGDYGFSHCEDHAIASAVRELRSRFEADYGMEIRFYDPLNSDMYYLESDEKAWRLYRKIDERNKASLKETARLLAQCADTLNSSGHSGWQYALASQCYKWLAENDNFPVTELTDYPRNDREQP